MDDDLKFCQLGRRPHIFVKWKRTKFFGKWKTTSIFWLIEDYKKKLQIQDDINTFDGRQTQNNGFAK